MQAPVRPENTNRPANDSFWEHLDALRSLLLRGAVLFIAAAIIIFLWMPEIFDSIILAPCREDFPLYRLLNRISESGLPITGDESPDKFHIELINIALATQFMLHVSTSLWLALIVCTPLNIYLIWKFVAPALYKSERSAIRCAMLFGAMMFYAGIAVSYFMIFPLTLRFLSTYQLSPEIPNVIAIDSYMDTLTGLSLIMGITFELPLVSWLLGKIGLADRSFFIGYRRHAIVALLILAAIITPTGDPFTLFVVFIPLYLLWELSALLVPKEIKKRDNTL